MSVTEPSEARKSTKSAVPPRAWKTSMPSSALVSNRSPRFSVAFLAAARRVISWTASSVSPASAAGVLVAAMAVMAVRQDAQIMAQAAVIGGMAAPILVSDGSGNYLVLFSYLALLNTGIAAIARFKAWRPLNLTGFVCTFCIALFWGLKSYTPGHFSTTEPCLI